MEVWEVYKQAVDEFKAENFDATLKLLEEVTRRDPNYKKAYMLESYVWNRRHNYFKEFIALTKALPLFDTSNPDQKSLAAHALSLYGDVCRALAMPEESVKALLMSGELLTDNAEACEKIGRAIFSATASENFSADDFRKLYNEYKKRLSDVVPYQRRFYNHKKIRVGFLSADFKNHVVMRWSWHILTELNKNLFEVYCYSNFPEPNVITEHLSKVSEGWRDIFGLTDEQAAKLIHDDEIDILFDLGNYTSNTRLRVATYRPAPVQVSGIGFTCSTGLDCFDYFLSDVHCADNSSAMREYFTEKIIVMPQTHACYTPTGFENKFEKVDSPPCLKNGYVTFGSFNKFDKVTDKILGAWKKILDVVPNSRLLLKHKIFNTDDGKNFVAERLKSFGIDIERVEMRGYTANAIAEYADMDIALDTFPYNGGITTCEALFMGVPVISLYGDIHGTRISYSLLKNIGLDVLAVNSVDDYISRAVTLADDWELLTDLRKNMRGIMERSPLMDSANYVKSIERAFIEILNAERKNQYV